MLRFSIIAAALAFGAAPAQGASASLFTDLHGKACKTIERDHESGASTRRCLGVGGYNLLVHEAHAQTSVDIVTPKGAVYRLDYWDVVTPGLAHVGRKAEWVVESRGGKLVPRALLVRLNTAQPHTPGPRFGPGAVLTASRIASDGACVVYQGAAASRRANAQARRAAVDPRRKCLGVYTAGG